jgi:phosphopantetheinyl transferase
MRYFVAMPFTQDSRHLAHSSIHFIHYDDFDPTMYLEHLTTDEQERFFSFSSEHRKKEFVATRYLRHQLFGFEHIHYDAQGAPYIKGEGFISISHTAGLVGMAFNKDFRIGLDIELRSDKAKRVYSKFLSEKEQAYFNVTNDDEMTTAWSTKETLYKIAGRNKIDFKTDLHLQPLNDGRILGSIQTEGLLSSAEIHTFVEDSYIFTINESPLKPNKTH